MSYPSVVTPRRIAIAALLALLGLCVAAVVLPHLPVGGPLGSWMASRDVASGVYAYQTPLLSVPWEKEWKRTMHCEYGIQIRGESALGLNKAFGESYNQAYNRVQLAAIESRFGSNVVFTIRDRLRQAWNTRTAKS